MKKAKIKRSIAGLLALVQLGLIAGCSNKDIEEDKRETLAVIEEMQDADAILEEKIDDAICQDIDTFSKEYEAIKTSHIEILENGNENSNIFPDEENKDEKDLTAVNKETSIVKFDEEFLKELGIDFNITQDENIQHNISILNDFLSQYQNVSYSVNTNAFQFDGHNCVLNTISYNYSDNTIAEVKLTKDNDSREVDIELMPIFTQEDVLPSNVHTSLINSRWSIAEDYSYEDWVHGSTKYNLYDDKSYFNDVGFLNKHAGIYTRNSDTGLDIILSLYLNTYTNKHTLLSEGLNLPNAAHSLALVVVNDSEFQKFEVDITLEEYKSLYDIMHLNKSYDIELELKNALIEIIQKHASEEQNNPLIDMLNDAKTYKYKI